MIFYRFLFFAISLNILSIFGFSQTRISERKISGTIKTCFDSSVCSSIIIGVIDNENISYFIKGYEDSLRLKEINEHSQFETGQISCLFTGILTNNIQNKHPELNQLYLTDIFGKEFKMPKKGEKKFKLSCFFNQSTSINSVPSNFRTTNPMSPFVDYSAEDAKQFLEKLYPEAEPCLKMQFSLFDIAFSALISSQIEKMSFKEMIRQKILIPENLFETKFCNDSGTNKNYVYSFSGNSTRWQSDFYLPVNGLISSASDMMKFIKSQQEVLNKPDSLNLNKVFSPAWNRHIDLKGSDYYWYEGSTNNHSVFLGFNPESNQGIVICMNSPYPLKSIGFYLLNLSDTCLVRAKFNRNNLKIFTGEYTNEQGSIYTILKQGNNLFIHFGGNEKFELLRISKNQFYQPSLQYYLTFSEDSGEISTLIISDKTDVVLKRNK